MTDIVLENLVKELDGSLRFRPSIGNPIACSCGARPRFRSVRASRRGVSQGACFSSIKPDRRCVDQTWMPKHRWTVHVVSTLQRKNRVRNSWQDQTISVANGIRKRVLELTIEQNGCYLSQALSSAEILATLYTKTLNIGPSEGALYPPPFAGVPGCCDGAVAGMGGAYNGPHGSDKDRLLISPAHYAVAVYAALVETGRLSKEALLSFNTDGSTVEMIGAEHSPGFELTTGSFGQALSQAGGIAMARRRKGETGRVFVFMSDGELEEGQTWEAVQCLAHYKIDNVIVVIDVNGQQVDGLTRDVMNIEPIAGRIEGFGARTIIVDGHDVEALDAAINSVPNGRPLFVLAYTDSAKGIPLLESRKPLLHFVRFNDDAEKRQFTEFLNGM